MAQIETRALSAPTTHRGESICRGAFVCIGNLAQIRDALGLATSLQVLDEFRSRLSKELELPADQVVHAGDDCFLVWLTDGCETQLEELMVRMSARPVEAGAHSLSLVVHTGWTELRSDEPRALLTEEAAYVLFTSASSVVLPPCTPNGDRFLSDMAVASTVATALESGRVDCQWQGISGLYGSGAFLYWRGVAQLDAAALDVPFGLSHGFMSSLERLNLTRVIDRHMALRVLGQLISMPSLRLACRISPLSVQNDHYWQHLLSTLAANPSAARRFTLEISGQAPLPSREAARAFSSAIHERGAHIALANFGCGAISLADVQACQPRTLLLDESFVERCRSNAEERVALRDMIRICAHLAEQIVVTGVHDEEGHSDAMRAGARWISGSYVNAAPPFASKFWRSYASAPRSGAPLCSPRSHSHNASSRTKPEEMGRVDWRVAGQAMTRSFMQ